MSQSNTGYTGEAVIKSGTVKMGDATSFGNIGRDNYYIRVKGDATFDVNHHDATSGAYTSRKNQVVLEEGAKLTSSTAQDNNDTKLSGFQTIKLDGDAEVVADTTYVSLSLHYNYWPSRLELGTHTLTKTGANQLYLSICTITGTGMLDIEEGGVTIFNGNNGSLSTCENGTIRIGSGGRLDFSKYSSGAPTLSVKNLELYGSVTRVADSSTLTVTGYISGTGTTPMLTLANGATLKPKSITGGLTVTDSLTLSGSINVDLSEINLSSKADGSYFAILTAPADGEFNLANVTLNHGGNGSGWELYSRETYTGSGKYELGVYLRPDVTWRGASGTWSDTSFNGGTDNYTTGQQVVFSDSGASNDPLAITVSGAKTVSSLDFIADNRDMTLSGDAISAGTVSKAGDGIATVNNALSVTTSISVTDGVLVLNPTAEVVADEWTASDSGTLVVYVDSGNTTTISIPITATKLIKRGAGVLILENAANTISQGTIIEAGTIKVNQKKSDNISQVFGSGSVTIAADGNGVGGALDVNNCYVENQIYICGNGPDGNGALINNNSDMGSDKRWKVSLTGNASWGGSKYIHFGASSSIVLNGHTFTKKGSNSFPLNNTTMSGNGTIVVEAGQFQNNNNVNNLSGIDIVIKSDATLNMAGGTSLSVKNCTFEGTTATVTANAAVANSANLIVNGTLTVNGTLSLPKLEMASGSGISFAGTGAAITVGNAFALPASGTVTLDVTSLTLPTGTDKLTLFSTTTALDLTKFSVTGNSDYYLQQNAQDAETNPGAVTLQLYAAKDDAGGYYRDATGALLAMAANHSLTLTILDGTEEDDWTADELSPRGLERSGTSVYYVAAKIGSTPYNSLQGAVDAATGGETIMLAFNSDDSITLNGKNIVFSEGSYTFSGSFTGNGTVELASALKSAATARWAEGWTGTVVLPVGALSSPLNFNLYGISGSSVQITGAVSGYLPNEEIVATVKIPSSASLTLTAFSPSYVNAFAKIEGEGALSVPVAATTGASGNDLGNAANWGAGYNYSAYLLIKDVSKFTGSLTANQAVGIAIGSSKPHKNTVGGKIIVDSGASATIASGKTWSAVNGIVVNGTLNVAGTVTGGITSGNGLVNLTGGSVDLGTLGAAITHKYVAVSGESSLTLQCEYNDGSGVIFNGDAIENPFIKVESGATLNLSYGNFSGWSGDVCDGYIVNEGTLNISQKGSVSTFFRNHLILTDGCTTTIGGSGNLSLYGGVATESTAQIQLVSGEAEISSVSAGIGFGNVSNQGVYGGKGVGIAVGDDATLTISAQIYASNVSSGSNPVAKYGNGTLVLSNSSNSNAEPWTLYAGVIKSVVALTVSSADTSKRVNDVSVGDYHVYSLVPSPAEITTTSFGFNSFTYGDNPVTLGPDDTVIVPSDCTGDQWNPTLSNVAGHPVIVRKDMNWKAGIVTMTIDSGVTVYAYAGYKSVINNGSEISGTGTLSLNGNVPVEGVASVLCTVGGSGKLLLANKNAILTVSSPLEDGKVITSVTGAKVISESVDGGTRYRVVYGTIFSVW